MSEAFICDAVRTAIGRYSGVLSSVRPDDLAAGLAEWNRSPTSGPRPSALSCGDRPCELGTTPSLAAADVGSWADR